MPETNPLPFIPQAHIVDDILKELKRAKSKHPNFPDHMVARAAIVAEESGELIRAAINYKYERQNTEDQIEEMRKEAIQCAATCIRFLENL